MYTSQERLGSVILDIDDLRIDVTFLDDSGIVRDEFTLFTGSAPVLEVTGLQAGAQATFTVSNTAPGNQVILGASLAGAGPTPTVYGDLALSPPLHQVASGPSDAAGDFNYAATVPAGLAGASAWFHAVEVTGVGTGVLSNALVEVVL